MQWQLNWATIPTQLHSDLPWQWDSLTHSENLPMYWRNQTGISVNKFNVKTSQLIDSISTNAHLPDFNHLSANQTMSELRVYFVKASSQ